jgi:hypothetical protein
VEKNPEFEVIVREVVGYYDSFINTKSKIRRSEEGKKLDKSIKKLRRYLDKDETRYYT